MPIKLQSSSGGSVTVNIPVTASNYNVTVPAATGTAMVSGNMPAFSYYASTATTLKQNRITYDVDFLPVTLRGRLKLAGRYANQIFRFGFIYRNSGTITQEIGRAHV
mgnify:CR=1 FL=1